MRNIEFKEFTLVSDAGNTLILTGIPKDQPILWHNQGLFRIIPVEVVRDLTRISRDLQKQPGIVKEYTPMIFWGQGLDVPARVGKALCYDKGSYQAGDSTDSNDDQSNG